MCGRFTFQPREEFYQRFQMTNRLDGLVARYNIAPGPRVPVIMFACCRCGILKSLCKQSSQEL
jgi:putative SOS response-associated peptidase YedK